MREETEEGGKSFTYLCDDRACANDGSFADDAVREDDRVAADEDVVFNYDRAAGEHALTALARGRVDAGGVAVEADIWTDNGAVTDDDIAGILHVAACADDHVVAQVDVVAVVAVEGSFDDGAVTDATRADKGGEFGADVTVAVVCCCAFGWVDDGREEARALVCAYGFRGFGGVVVAFDGRFALLAIVEERVVDVVEIRLAE